MKSGIRSTGETRYRTAAASAIFAALGRTGSTARPVMVRTMDGRARSSALMSFQALGHQLADILHGEPLLGALHLAAEIDHGQTEGTAGPHHVYLGLERLLDADQVHALLRLHFHPHVTAAPAAAEPALTIARRSEEHTSELQSRPHLVCRPLLA